MPLEFFQIIIDTSRKTASVLTYDSSANPAVSSADIEPETAQKLREDIEGAIDYRLSVAQLGEHTALDALADGKVGAFLNGKY